MKKKVKESTITVPEWMWVDGYKGTDKNMVCRDYQFKLGELHEMPEDAEIKACSSGFHLCRSLDSVFTYYGICHGNRFFKVRALVRASDFFGVEKTDPNSWRNNDDKLVAKSIQFISEVSMDEIFAAHSCHEEFKEWSLEEKRTAIEHSIGRVRRERSINELVTTGYAKPFAAYLEELGVHSVAVAVGSQQDLSMDTKVKFLIEHIRLVAERNRNSSAYHGGFNHRADYRF